MVSDASKTVGGRPSEEEPVRRGWPAAAGPAAAAGPPRPPGHPPRQALPGPATGHGHAAVLDVLDTLHLGLHRDLVFALKSLYRGVREDLVFVLVPVFNSSKNLVEILCPFSAFSDISSKSRYCISINFLFFPFFSPCFSCFFPCFSCFSLKNDVSCLVSFPIYANFSSLIPSCFPFTLISCL